MSEQMLHDDALEQRLRAHYTSEYGQPPAPSATWERISANIGVATTTREHVDARDTDWTFGDTTNRPHPLSPPPRHDRHPWPLRLLPLVAAALLVAVFATLLLGPLGHAGSGLKAGNSAAAKSTATPGSLEAPGMYAVHVLAPDEMLQGDSLRDLQMLSADDGWAVGQHRVSPSAYESAILHYTNGRWSASRDVFPNVELLCISMVSPTEGWAAGHDDNSPSHTALLHYSGGRWTRVQAPGSGPIIHISMLAPDDGWGVQLAQYADGNNPPRFALLHYDGTAWSPVDIGGMSLTSLAMVSPSEGWAAGLDGVIAHFQNGRWTRWHTNSPGDVDAITMVSPTDGWMAGVTPGLKVDPSYSNGHLFMLHYDGRDWRPVNLPALPRAQDVLPNDPYNLGDLNSTISGISMSSADDGWAAGDLQGTASVLYHYSGGTWHLSNFAVNESLSKVWMVSADEGWAIGAPRNLGNEAAVILHYSHGSWTIYKP